MDEAKEPGFTINVDPHAVIRRQAAVIGDLTTQLCQAQALTEAMANELVAAKATIDALTPSAE